MIKELVIYKKPDKEFILKESTQVTSKHRRLHLEGNDGLEYDDLIWAKKDMDATNRANILAVEFVYDDGSVRVRLQDEASMKKMRKFTPGESFLLIASFKESKDGDPSFDIS